MKINLVVTEPIAIALENYRATEIDKLHRMKMQIQSSTTALELSNVSYELDKQIDILEQANEKQLAEMHLQRKLLDEYENYVNDPQYVLRTYVEATFKIVAKDTNEILLDSHYNSVKELHDDLIHTVDQHHNDFTEPQWTVYEAALEGIELALQNIDTLPAEYSQTFCFESNTHKYEVSFFNPF